MLVTSEYIALPIVAAMCFFFLLFSLINTRGVMIVTRLRLVIYSCLMWTLGNIFMQIQLSPGIVFWHNISILGLYLLPIALYNLVFGLIGVKKEGFLIGSAALVVAMVIVNAKYWSWILPPEGIKIKTGLYWYKYSPSVSAYISCVCVFAFVVYCSHIAEHAMSNNAKQAKGIKLLFFSVLIICSAVLLELIINKGIPYGVVASVPLVITMEIILAKYYKMHFFEQIRAAVICVGVIVFALIPAGADLGPFANLKYYAFRMDGHDIKMVIVVTAAMSILVAIIAQALASMVGLERKNKIKGYTSEFAQDMLGVLGYEDFGNLLRGCLKKICPAATPAIYLKHSITGNLEPIASEDEEALSEAQLSRIVDNLTNPAVLEEQNVRLLRNNGEVIGFITLVSKDVITFDSVSEDAIGKLCLYASLFYKNSNVYDTIYQMSIVDSVSGLYNKGYWLQYMDTRFLPKTTHACLYLNVDNFRLYKALYGDAVADKIIGWIGKIVRDAMQDIGTAFRIGEDEIVIDIAENDKDRVKNYIDIIISDLKCKTDTKPDVKETITVSIGVSTCPGTTSSCNHLLDQAKKACLFAKKSGKAKVEFYSDENTEAWLKDRYGTIQPFVDVLMSLIDEKDSYTYRHSMNVAKYAEILGRAVKIPEYEIPILREAALLHDVGKINTPSEILLKQGELQGEELQIMRDHVSEAMNIIHYMPDMEFVIPAVAAHHERYDGTGYPKGLVGENIPLFGRIIAICDAYDAMASSRPYRKQPLTEEQAVQELLDNSETQFDPLLVESMVELIRDGKIFPDIAARTTSPEE